jgi:hypothetical protein
MNTDGSESAQPVPEAGASLDTAEIRRLVEVALSRDHRALAREAIRIGVSVADLIDEVGGHASEIATVSALRPEAEESRRDRTASEFEAFLSLPWWRRRMPGGRSRQAFLSGALQRASEEVRAASAAGLIAARVGATAGFIREFLNRDAAGRYETRITEMDPEALAESDDVRYAIPTQARARLDWLLANLSGGSIGLAGPRGAGKSTLMRVACNARTATAPAPVSGQPDTRPVFAVMVSAPVQFEARDFILHLFGEICQKAVGRGEVASMREPAPFAEPEVGRELLWRIIRWLPIAVGLYGLALVGVSFLPRGLHLSGTRLTGITIVLAAGVVWLVANSRALMGVSAGISLGISVRPPHIERGDPSPLELPGEVQEQARALLRDIWFQQTFTSGWSGALNAPAGLSAGVSGSRELAKQPLNLPVVIASLRRCVLEIAQTHQVRIGVDELDKIESKDAPWNFMNEIKALFLLPNCFFLISVSEDAMSSFQRRGLPFRDAFDSSFDDVVAVKHLTTARAVELVERRVVGLRVPFILLCHCMAGGLPSDLIRASREIVTAKLPNTDLLLSDIGHTLVGDDARSKAEAALVAFRQIAPTHGRDAALAWLHEMSYAEHSATTLLDATTGARDVIRALCPITAGSPSTKMAPTGRSGSFRSTRRSACTQRPSSHSSAPIAIRTSSRRWL